MDLLLRHSGGIASLVMSLSRIGDVEFVTELRKVVLVCSENAMLRILVSIMVLAMDVLRLKQLLISLPCLN
jgi:hypothetical protein